MGWGTARACPRPARPPRARLLHDVGELDLLAVLRQVLRLDQLAVLLHEVHVRGERPLGLALVLFFFFFLPSSSCPLVTLGLLRRLERSVLVAARPSPLPSPPSPSSFFAPLSFFGFFFGAARSSSSSEPSSYSSSTSDSAPGAKSSSSPSLSSSSSSSSSASCCWRCRLTRCRYGSSSASSSSSSSAARACELTFLIVMLVAFRKRKSSLGRVRG